MMEPMQFLGVIQQELEHQRQLMEQMQQQMRQMQHQEQQAREAQTQQGAPPSGGNERQSLQVIMNWSWKIKTAVSGMNEGFVEMPTTAETGGHELRVDDREERVGDGSGSIGEVKNVGANVQSATRVHVSEVYEVRLAIMQWEEKWKVMMSELGEGAKIPDLWRMSALLEICPKDVKE